MREAENTTAPDALLLIASGCPHCPTVLQGLSELVKAGLVGRLEVVNIGAHPEIAQAHGVRGVPWLRLGPFELEGLRAPAELRRWAERAGSAAGMADYFAELLKTGQLEKVTQMLAAQPAGFKALLQLLADPDTDLHVRVGIGAVMEEFAGSATLQDLIAPLGELTLHTEAHVRGDAAHYLALTKSADAAPYLRSLLNDPEPQVRELAAEGLAALGLPTQPGG